MASAVPRRTGSAGSRLALNLVLLGFAVLVVAPFVTMVFGSVKTPAEITSNPGGIPRSPTVDNFGVLFTGETGMTVWRGLLNSVIVTVPFTAITVVLCAMAGYAFTRYDFRGRKAIFVLMMASILVPFEVNLPSLYAMFAQIGWLNTYQVQILPGTASVIGMFMARQYMSGLPGEVFEAARLDGAGHWRTFRSIALPMSTPVLGAVALLTFVAKWSDYLWPRVVANDPTFQPIMVLLPALSTSQDGFIVRYELLLAGAAIVTLPLLLLFLVFQSTLMSGTTAGAVRG
ncbi:carbohydrate ABC transporter permease [Kineococcus glutinatus]|uniref:Carbohydrate ABC transporter permease n=1 Tax=Kineococcus glutinatus TaxID=1070872 RepID=A0ABP9HDL6_9ACTN